MVNLKPDCPSRWTWAGKQVCQHGRDPRSRDAPWRESRSFHRSNLRRIQISVLLARLVLGQTLFAYPVRFISLQVPLQPILKFMKPAQETEVKADHLHFRKAVDSIFKDSRSHTRGSVTSVCAHSYLLWAIS